jgi:hypothetical protein
MSATISLPTTHHSRVRLFAAGAALAMVAGGTAVIVANVDDDAPAKPAPVVAVHEASDSQNSGPLFTHSQSASEQGDQLTLHNGRR